MVRVHELAVHNNVTRIYSGQGIDAYVVKTDKFKTNSINIFFHDNLSRDTASLNALVPSVLRRGCERFKTFREIALYLEELYGASFDCGVTKKGEHHIIQFYTEFVSDKYTGKNTNNFEKAFDLMYEIINKPVVENGFFNEEYVRQEKENLIKLINSRINDKVQYAVEKCYEEMCSEEPFGVYDYGTVEDVKEIDGAALFRHYREMLESYPVKIFISGSLEEDRIKAAVERFASIKRSGIKEIKKPVVQKEVSEVKRITDKLDVNQAKLSLGFRTNITADSEEYYKLLVYNGILGGGIHSKLFRNVRENASLAYYIFSRLEKFKGLMVISSGIDADKREKAEEIILRQVKEISEGNISDYEFDSTLKSIETGINSLNDSQLQVVDFYLSQSITGGSDTLHSLTEKVMKVRKKDVAEVASRIKLDTVYFLTP